MKYYVQLLRPRDWAKNLFLIVPSFFAGQFFVRSLFLHLIEGFISFCFIASAIYIINDYRDIEDDKKHPVKCNRPLASGKVKKPVAIGISLVLIIVGALLGAMADPHLQFLFILIIYFFINLFYSFGLKNFAILDILMLSSGFVLRVKGGAMIAGVEATPWLIIMTFLLSLFMAIAKRRDDLLLTLTTGTDMRKSIRGYNLDFLDTMLGLSSAIVIVAYINYTVSPVTVARLGTHRLYYSSLFVIAGLMRYLQITFVFRESGSPTEILYKDRFIQITLGLWVASIYVILYLKDVNIFAR